MATRTPLDWKNLFEQTDFCARTAYDGPLGLEFDPSGLTLRLWAPTAEEVQLCLYLRGDGGQPITTHAMARTAPGVWVVRLGNSCAGLYYTYRVTVDGETKEITDPYARTTGLNGQRGQLLDLRRTDPKGWHRDTRPHIPPHRRSVWEVSVRDFSDDPASGVPRSMRGKYLAFTQTGTTYRFDGVHPTCLSYLKQLGVSYVQLMPVYDFGSVDEAHGVKGQYNWGYDPVNFNVPDGSYSSDSYRGEARVTELKQLVQAVHSAGMGVIMDVVYNHMWQWDNALNGAVPYYYFRQGEDGEPSNGSGCGNEIASERPMVRRYIVDSLVYWATEYHMDGFRFDLMGLLDVDTMNAARAALDALPGGEEILMYGEPWQGGGSTIRAIPSDKSHLPLLNERIGIFCDNTRDAIKGSCFDAASPGYVNGQWDRAWDIGAAAAAWCRSTALQPRQPGQIVNYASAHDNFTLWDKLLMTAGEAKTESDFTAPTRRATEKVLAQNRLAAGIYLTCMGLPFMQAGEEFARTKRGEGNSYRSSVLLNRLDWSRTIEQQPLVDYYRGLLALRAEFPALGGDWNTAQRMEFFSLTQPLVGWRLDAEPGDGARWRAICVFFNPTGNKYTVPIPPGRWRLLCDGYSSFLWRGFELLCVEDVNLQPVTATILGLL